jgi:hypothetical protein
MNCFLYPLLISNQLFAENFFSLSPNGWDNNQKEQASRTQKQRQTDRAPEEDAWVATGKEHGTAQIFLHQRTEDKSEHQGRRFTIELDEYVSQQAEGSYKGDFKGAVVHTVYADAAKEENG